MRVSDLNNYICRDCGSYILVYLKEQCQSFYEIWDGVVQCVGCGAEFPIIKGIPRFVPVDNYANSFGFQWNLHNKTQLDSNTGLPISKNRIFDVTGWSSSLAGQKILEAGSGAGRFTEILLGTGADVFSFDYSSAVEANYANNGNNPLLHMFQGDIYNIPLRKSYFDKVICLGVLQHTPDPERAFKSLAEFVRPGGELVIDVYRLSLPTLLPWKYVLRPLTKKMHKEKLYRLVERWTPPLIPVAKFLKGIAGRAGARLMPILEYSHLGLSPDLNQQWAILDTFDMLSPLHDHPQTLASVNKWFKDVGFYNVEVCYGSHGLIGKGKKPLEV